MKPMRKHADVLRAISQRQRISGPALLAAYRKQNKISAIRQSKGFDDRNDVFSVLATLTDQECQEFKLQRPTGEIHRMPELPHLRRRHPNLAPLPIHHVRVHAILCTNDDGSGGGSMPHAVNAEYLKDLIVATNAVYECAGIQFLYDPDRDFERIADTRLNLDFIVPEGLNYYLPKDQPPLSEAEAVELGAAHSEARRRIGLQHRHKMVLLFCEGNCLYFDDSLNKWTLIPRTWAFSGSDCEYVALPTGQGDVRSFAYLVAHETGHYYHQPHTHGWQPKTIAEAAGFIRTAVENGTYTREDGLKVFDGDGWPDTPPDPGNTLFDTVYGLSGCGLEDSLDIPVEFSDGTTRKYVLKPDRTNALSYFKHCTNFTLTFSPMQIAGMRLSLEQENRWHLIHPSMRLHAAEVFVLNEQPAYCAVWKTSEEPEIQVYGWTQADLRAKYDELWQLNWRLKCLVPYVVNDQVLYTAVWRKGEEDEIQVYDWAYADVRAKYDELWPKGWRLTQLAPFVVNGNVRYAAVWKPGTEEEVQVYDWPYADVRAKYDELWPKGWRLKQLAPFVVNGDVRYAAVWRPGTEGEIQVYDWAYADVRAKYDELWPQGWRLKQLSPFVVDGKVRYAAVWRPGVEGEIQVYGWAYEDYRALYDRMW